MSLFLYRQYIDIFIMHLMIFMVQVCLSPTTQEVGVADKTKCRLSAQPLATYIRLLGKRYITAWHVYTTKLYAYAVHYIKAPYAQPTPSLLWPGKDISSAHSIIVCVCVLCTCTLPQCIFKHQCVCIPLNHTTTCDMHTSTQLITHPFRCKHMFNCVLHGTRPSHPI